MSAKSITITKGLKWTNCKCGYMDKFATNSWGDDVMIAYKTILFST